MANFLFVYRGGSEDGHDLSPEAMQKVMQTWMDWMQDGVKNGWLVDGGDGLKPEGKVVRADGGVTDGPFAEAKELVGGYSIVSADNLTDACAHAKTNPMIQAGGTVEVRELAGHGQDNPKP